jgi:N-acetylmuramoyl-L-alanine amidase
MADPDDPVVWRRSPNFAARRDGGVPAMVVLHYTAMGTVEEAVGRLCDVRAEVSAHFLIGSDGAVIRMVAEDMRAWHAGVSGWGPLTDVNSWSIGVELSNPGHEYGYPPFPEPQMRSLEALLAGVRRRWSIPPERVVGHACIAPGRKIDPGEKLDWRRLAMAGHGVWLEPPMVPADAPADPERFRAAAAAFGYKVDFGPGWTDRLRDVWQSYAMRFLAGTPLWRRQPCAAGVAHLEALAARWPVRSFAAGSA